MKCLREIPEYEKTEEATQCPKPMKRVLIKISGRVQGVFFRQDTKRKANELGLTGWVRNKDDGTVLILAEGLRERLEELHQWLKGGGPPFAKIEDIEVQWEEGTNEFNDFVTR